MKTLVAFLLVSLAVSAWAADGKSVSYKSGDETVQGMLYAPAGKGPFPALIVIHEWWGLNDWVKEQAAKLADEGYVALAVDLYRGKVADTPELAHEIMRGVPQDRALRDLKAAYDFLAAQPNVKKDRIGSIGWCMGGGYSLDTALAEPGLAAAVINYGHLATDSGEMKKTRRRSSGTSAGRTAAFPPRTSRSSSRRWKSWGRKST
jgi:carboxymethylenebutenolidase